MRHTLILILSLLPFSYPGWAGGEPTIFDVRKPIALSDKEVVQKDFYINAGSEAGLQKGMIITIVRKVPLYDTYQSRSAGDLNVPVAKVKIIQVQQGNAVARFQADIGRNDIPILEEPFIMVGDKLDLSTATKDKKSASNDGDGEAPSAAPEPKKEAAPVTLVPALPPPPPAQVTSQKVEEPAKVPKDALAPTEGPTIR